jgi:hypothetical protein
MTATITVKTTHNLGIIKSSEGNTPYWRVAFQLDGPEFLIAEISVPVKGPTSPRAARQEALKVLRDFLSEAYAVAKHFEI